MTAGPLPRAIEFGLLFLALPVLYRYGFLPLHPFPVLWILAAGCLLFLLASPEFDRRRLWNARDLGRRCARAMWPFVVIAPLLGGATWLLEPQRLFAFVRQRPLVWAAVMLLYPVLSAYPQGIIYRAFIFHRYGGLFPCRWATILASALAFSVVHVVFQNRVAPVLSFGGGLLFAWTYERTRSSLVATLQHALFGCFIFTIGLGWYFYYGAVH